MIAIIDCGCGNLESVKNAFNYIGKKAKITGNPEEIAEAGRIVLPGVGSFGYMMEQLRNKRLIGPIKESIGQGRAFLGICLGLQALFEESEESPLAKGLGIFRGKVVKFREGKVPQVGWNRIVPRDGNGLFRGEYFYFVNSYYAIPKERSIIAASANYSGDFCSAVQCKNIAAVQFHPEKSGKPGLALLERWLEC